jgi:hypothetical protein
VGFKLGTCVCQLKIHPQHHRAASNALWLLHACAAAMIMSLYDPLIYVCTFLYFVELSLISLHWFLTAFASVVHIKVLLRLWDLFFYEGSAVLFQLTLGMLKMKVCTLYFVWLYPYCL